ncbi:MAG: TIGR03087 family PEP-CTERM/XrtA system glycosyltransferase [Desulfobacterales bacterium]|nr:TIGR03087 family PEP-CTERM/XrtA system glycosyltransferase [Desulfobacterales bacterium]
MRILCLTPRLPYPPYRGDRLRAFHIIERLAEEHELSLVSFIAERSEQDHLAPLRSLCRDVHVVMMSYLRSMASVMGNLWRSDPMQALFYRSEKMRQLIAEILKANHFDVAYVHLFRMAPYLADASQLYRIVDMTDVISKGIGYSLPYRQPASRVIYHMEKPRISRYECWVAQNFEETWLISEAERQVLAPTCPGANIQVVTNGVDTEHFHPIGQPCDPKSLIFVGNLSVFHNVDAVIHLVRDVLPLVRQQVPDCRLNIVGANSGARIQRLGKEPGVTVTGFVPDLNDCLNRSAVLVAPLRAVAGVQNKVLEAMAAGRPVVTTRLVNQGLGAQPDRDLLVADDAEKTANQIVTLLHNEHLRTQLGQAGRQFVRRKFKWDDAAERMRAVEAQLIPIMTGSNNFRSRSNRDKAATR